MKQILLQFPEINEHTITAFYCQARPYRKNGYRIETQKFQDKFLFHNYGHGGSGVSMSYGSGIEVYQLFKKTLKEGFETKKCAVLGSGILGLMTALVLSEEGQQVKVYAQSIPNFGQKDNNKMITSEVAPGFWFPYDYIDYQIQMSERIRKNSYEYLSKCIRQQKFKGLKFAWVYQDTQSGHDIVLQQQSKKTFQKRQIKFMNGEKKVLNSYQSIRLDMQPFLQDLISYLKLKGVKFVKKTLKDKKQVLNFSETYIFNCLGNGAKYVFKDDQMEHVVGHIVQIKNPNPNVFNYIFLKKVQKDQISIFCQDSRILVGYTRENHYNLQVNMQVIQEIIKKTNAYIRQRNMINPKL